MKTVDCWFREGKTNVKDEISENMLSISKQMSISIIIL